MTPADFVPISRDTFKRAARRLIAEVEAASYSEIENGLAGLVARLTDAGMPWEDLQYTHLWNATEEASKSYLLGDGVGAIVVNLDGNSNPNKFHQHATTELAIKEATRLTQKGSTSRCAVYKPVAIISATPPDVRYIK